MLIYTYAVNKGLRGW